MGIGGFINGSFSAHEVLPFMSFAGALDGGHLTSTGRDHESFKGAQEAGSKSSRLLASRSKSS